MLTVRNTFGCCLTIIYILFLFTSPVCAGNFQGSGGDASSSGEVSASDLSNTSGSSPSSSSQTSRGSKLSMDQAVKQAESEIPPVREVYDVTDPAIVYSQLQPYVDKWRETLPVPTNKWGIDISSPVVVSSTRPDFVPAKLITFIMGELSKEKKAGAFGLEGAAETRSNLEKERKDKVKKRAQEIFKEANESTESSNSSATGAASTGTSGSESSNSPSQGSSSSEDKMTTVQIPPQPITEESDDAAGIDRDLDGEPDELNYPDRDYRTLKSHKTAMKLSPGSKSLVNYLCPETNMSMYELLDFRENNNDTVYLYVSNGSAPTPFSPCSNGQFSGSLSPEVVKEMKYRLAVIQNKRLDIILWLRADGMSKSASLKENLSFQKNIVKELDTYTSSWVIGYEVDKYYEEEEIAELVSDLQKHTNKPVGIHCSSLNKFELALSAKADVFYGSYGMGCSPEEITEKTSEVVEKLKGKADFVAAEYHNEPGSSQAVELGQAAKKAGAVGTGNGR